jgi:hypothetical protein
LNRTPDRDAERGLNPTSDERGPAQISPYRRTHSGGKRNHPGFASFQRG